MAYWQARITIDPAVCHGRACVRGTRVMVSVILDNLAAGVPNEEIIVSYPGIQEPDIQAALAYAAELAREGTADLPVEQIGTSFAQSTLQALTKTGGYPVLDQGSGSDLRVWIFRESSAATQPRLTDTRPDAFVLDCEFLTEGTAWDVTRVNTGQRGGTEEGRWCELDDAVRWLTDHLTELPTHGQHIQKQPAG